MTIEVIYSHTVRWNRFLKFPCVYRMLRESLGLFKHWGCHCFQLKFKPLQVPPREPDGEVFGKHDMNNEKMADRRQRAYELFREQQDLVAQKKREAILRRLMEQREEEDVLERTKKEWVASEREREREFNYTNALISVLFKINKVFFFLSGLILSQMDLFNRLSVARIGKCPMSLNE